MQSHALSVLSDTELIDYVKRLAASEREATAALIALLAEFDARKLYLAAGHSSLFIYCVRVLALSEDAAYFRIEAARAGRRFPHVLERLAEGAITLTAVKLLAAHLTPDNHRALLDEARGRTKTTSRSPDTSHPAGALAATALATTCTDARPCAPSPRRAVIAPLTPERYKIQVTVSAETHAKLRTAQALLRDAVPDGDPAVIFDRALTVLLEHLERRKCARKKRRPTISANGGAAAPGFDAPPGQTGIRPPVDRDSGAGTPPRVATAPAGTSDDENRTLVPERPAVPKTRKRNGARTRYIPAEVKRAVWSRDGGSCTFVGHDGTRCGATAFLEYHHVVPYADGGATTAENLRLTCKAHNACEAERWSGDG